MRCSPRPRGSRKSVEVPVTVDAEAGYGMQPAELVAALRDAGAAGCNLEDTEWPARSLRDHDRHAEWLRAVRETALAEGYPLVINARIDAFFHPFLADEGGPQEGFVTEAVRRANKYLEAGVDCVYPICLWECRAAQLHVGSHRAGEHYAGATGAVDRRAVSTRRGPRELGPPPAVGRDCSLPGTARFASGLRTDPNPTRGRRGRLAASKLAWWRIRDCPVRRDPHRDTTPKRGLRCSLRNLRCLVAALS